MIGRVSGATVGKFSLYTRKEDEPAQLALLHSPRVWHKAHLVVCGPRLRVLEGRDKPQNALTAYRAVVGEIYPLCKAASVEDVA